MRKITVFTNVSLDGFFEAPGHDLSGFSNDFEAFPSGADNPVDTLLWGHATYEGMKFWSTPQAEQMMPEIARFMTETQKVVASHKPFEPGWQNVTVISGDIPGAVRRLKEQPGKGILVFGSSTLCVSLLQEGLIDELQIVINPVLFGAGTTLFQGLSAKTPLTLKETRRFKSGAVMLIYDPRLPA
jgi:dihydrofolate reductase